MAQEQSQNYLVTYTIDVEATKGTEQVRKFADSIGHLVQAKASLSPAVANIKAMMGEIDKAFRTPGGRKKDYSFQMNINTAKTEEKLVRVKNLLGEIREMTKSINFTVNAGQKVDSRSIQTQTRALLNKTALENERAAAKKTAAESFQNITTAQKNITKSVGKINAALISMEKERRVNINTDVAKQRLEELLGLLKKVKGAQIASLGMQNAGPGLFARNIGAAQDKPLGPFVMTEKQQAKLQAKLYADSLMQKQRLGFRQQEEAMRIQQRASIENVRRMEREQARIAKQNEAIQRKALADQKRQEHEAAMHRQRNAADAVRMAQRQSRINTDLYGNKRRAAINRLQYSKAPTFRNMPFAYMFNAYMGYSLMRRELTEAIEYANIMESAHSILKVSDNDLGTFETRFDKMAKYVRRIGVETKFTAIEVAGAVKYLSMAGMGIGTIMESIRPITNLALIGDNDISQIADLTTNIMAGYDIKSSSMPNVADILASTVSRSNVNIIEMAESYKMASGYMRLAGVDFTESAAAVGILGNMGIKGTMAGTSLRAMATRFAKPTREAQKTLDRLGVHFTEYHDVYGKQVERLRPLADIFEELKQKGATMADMQAIFGKIGGSASMMLLNNYDKLREMTAQNAASHGISTELAKVKQETTKGLWHQVTSQFSESFMQSFEILEPQIKRVLHGFLQKFQTPEFAAGLASIGRVLLDLLSTLGSIASWFAKNFSWLEPILFTGIVTTRLYKFAAVLTNLGVAIGFVGKQSAAASTMQFMSSLLGIGNPAQMKNLSFANKRAIVSALSAAGVTGKGAMTQYLMQTGMAGGASALLSRGAATGLFATQVATGNGLIGATAALGAIGTGAIAATAGISALVGALGWVAYKTWKIKEAKDAVQEEIEANKKYQYPSIEALYEALNKTYNQALNTKKAVDDVTGGKTVEEISGQKVGAFTGNWWKALISNFGEANGYNSDIKYYNFEDAYQDDLRNAIVTVAKIDAQNKITSAWGDLGKLRTQWEVGAYMQNIQEKYGFADDKLNKDLWTSGKDGTVLYKRGLGKLTEAEATQTYHYAKYQNEHVVPMIRVAAETYRKAITDYSGAREMMEKGGFDFGKLEELGFYRNDKGTWVHNELPKNATDKDRENQMANDMKVHDLLITFIGSLRATLGGNAEAAENVLKTAGFTRKLYSNEPEFNEDQPFNANDITNNKLVKDTDADDGMAGGNYSGTGKLSSAAPKQVFVNITNLLSVETIDLMKGPDGNREEIKDLKEQIAQALIDVVHDFDASWNG